MKINGQHMDDQRFKALVDILMGRTSTGIDATEARWAATAIAKRAVKEMMEWSEERVSR